MSNGRGDYYFTPNAFMPTPQIGAAVSRPSIGGAIADLAGGVIGGIIAGGMEQLLDSQLGQGGMIKTKLNPFGSAGRSGRRMNALNPKALRRSMRRVQAFAKFAKKTIQFTQRVKMKKRKR